MSIQIKSPLRTVASFVVPYVIVYIARVCIVRAKVLPTFVISQTDELFSDFAGQSDS
jgi:hypothetical protein